MVPIGNFFFRYRNGLVPLACLLVLLPSPNLFANPWIAAGVGFVVALAGQALRIATIGFEYVVRGGRKRRVYAEELVTRGLYRFSRNPMYVGNLLILGGLAIASNTWVCALIAAPLFIFVYVAIVAAEEQYLRSRFGEQFDRYCRAVPRWLPSLRALPDLGAHGRFRWKRVLIKEYGTPVGWISMLLAVLLWQLHRDADRAAYAGELTILVLYGALLVVYLCVRHLKLSRHLVAD
jgi:protein-S-isoprenylcysteine O-methyltransferase Ste14